MKRVSRSALLPFSAEQMFDLVNDVAAYPEFLPWCSDSRVIESSPTEMLASLTISKAGLSHSFSTRNQLQRPELIRLVLVDGPFSSLEGNWRFSQLGDDGCKAEMGLAFDFNSVVLNATLGKAFSHAADTMVDAFCDRARQVYG